jgi:hypothetical protein
MGGVQKTHQSFRMTLLAEGSLSSSFSFFFFFFLLFYIF